MSYINRPPPVNGNINTWGERLNDWLVRNQSKVAHYLAGQSATEDGILLWDATNNNLVVSSNGSWVAVSGGGGGGTITNYLRDDADDSTSFRLTMGGLTVDTDTLYVDSVNSEVGIGTTNPSEKLEVVGNVEATEFIGDLRGAVVFKAQAGEALQIGDVVYISGISGNTTVVNKADADDPAKMPAFGLAADNVNNNTSIEIYTFGTLSNLDTSSYSEGDELFVGTTAGALTDTAPTGESSLVQKIAKVTRSHGSAGSVKIMGAGRTNATPNLNDGNIFIGDSNNIATTASFATEVATATAGKADLSGATFTGNVTIGIPPSGSETLNVAGLTELYGGLDLNLTDITGVQTLTAKNVNISDTGSVTTNIATGSIQYVGDTKTLNLGTGFSSQGTTNVNIGSTTGTTDIAGNLTVDGSSFFNSVEADGNLNVKDGTLSCNTGTQQPFFRVSTTAVDNSQGLYIDGDLKINGSANLVTEHHFYSNLSHSQGGTQVLTTTLTTIGGNAFSTPSGLGSKHIDVSLDIIYYNVNYTNDGEFKICVDAPNPSSEDVESMGAVQSNSNPTSYMKTWTVTGDFTKHLSPYCGLSKNNTTGGASLGLIYDYRYDASTNLTYVTTGLYTNAPTNGDIIYLHPFDWESQGTTIEGRLYMLDGTTDSTFSIRRDFTQSLGYFTSAVGVSVKARKLSSSGTSLDNIHMDAIQGKTVKIRN